uniref:Plasma membrane ATPase 4 n=1 Tax=Tanacetum cinerariifolium TaxID=118510 RepID=A0A699IHH5_TANCI|nr:plasma membrane ATPase 4 [Tanacetum cinerariifolium]
MVIRLWLIPSTGFSNKTLRNNYQKSTIDDADLSNRFLEGPLEGNTVNSKRRSMYRTTVAILVHGNIKLGDSVLYDVRFLKGDMLKIEESALTITGESLPVNWNLYAIIE